MKFLGKMGPGLLVTAAFIGPGTITTASAAGAHYGFALLWALLFSVFATIVLQEMAARLGLVTRMSLAQAMRGTRGNKVISDMTVVLVIVAIGFGNAAYEVGNISGAALAASSVTGISITAWSLILGACSGALLATGRYQVLEGVLIVLVLIMSAVFVITAIVLTPDMIEIFRGMFIPTLPSGSVLTVIGLVGTTVVPYNLFLHANAVQQKWTAEEDLETSIRESRWDTGLAVGLGGLITLAVMSTAATAFFRTGLEFNAQSMGAQLEPLLGDKAKLIFAAGLFAGGLTSAITAPLAAAYAVCGAMGWSQDLQSSRFKLVWGTVLGAGTILAAAGSKPLTAIVFAQIANGFLLPFVAIFLLVVMNNRALLREHCNGIWANMMGGLVVLVAIGLGAIKLFRIFAAL
ncbi:MAG: manganese transport protein [Halioglobus sp.]|jgi:manganese transport protein